MALHQGRIEDATGDLIACGFSDFDASGELKAGETQRTDVPIGALVRGQEDETQMHNWNGSAYVLVVQP